MAHKKNHNCDCRYCAEFKLSVDLLTSFACCQYLFLSVLVDLKSYFFLLGGGYGK